MTPEKRGEVLAAYKAKKFKTAAELAKATGLSRSAVYRVIKSLDKEEPEPETQQEEPREATRRSVGDDFFHRTEKFSDAIGLPPDGSMLRHNVQEYSAQEQAEREAEMESVFDRIAGNSGVSARDEIPSVLMDKILGTPPEFPERGPPENTFVLGGLRGQEGQREPDHSAVVAAAQDYIQRIIFNVEHFGAHLKAITGPNKEEFIQSLATYSPPALRNLLATMERTRSVGNLTSGFKQAFYMASQATEVTSGLIGLKTQGFTQQLKSQDEEITMILKEIAINEWERLKNFDSPVARLGILFSVTLLQVDSHNRMQEHLRKVVNHPVNPAVVSANADL